MGRLLPALGLVAGSLLAGGCTPLGGSSRIDIQGMAAGVPPAHDALRAAAPAAQAAATGASLPRWATTPALSPGDRVEVVVADGEGFSGRYELGMDGTLRLPHLPPVSVGGAGTEAAARRIADALVATQQFRADRVQVSVLVHEWSHVQVHVRGAVFAPGMVTVNARRPEERALKRELSAGDFPSERMLAAALRAAGGVRPDAALDRIELIRDGRSLPVSYAGLIQGRRVVAVPLMSGDTIVVPSSGRFDPDLVAVSAITPPGIRVYLSNLTQPASGNAISAVDREASRLPYGSRLLTAAMSANCVGGIHATSAGRHVVLVRNDPLTGREHALERPINDLLRAPHRDDVNPYVMPDDAVACYDSGLTNLRDIARMVLGLVLPFAGR